MCMSKQTPHLLTIFDSNYDAPAELTRVLIQARHPSPMARVKQIRRELLDDLSHSCAGVGPTGQKILLGKR